MKSPGTDKKDLIPSKTGMPDIINNRLANTVDFHVASTNFHTILKSYINFLALSKYYDSLKYEADPITAEAKFWEDLANTNINLKKFASNPKASHHLKRVEAELNPNEQLKMEENGSLFSYIDSEGNLITETTDGRIIPLTKQIDDTVNTHVASIDTVFDLASKDQTGEFIAWWLDKYRKAHYKVKQVLSETLTIENTILQEISESIGFISDQWRLPEGRYLHYADDDSDPVPVPYNSIIEDKLEVDTRGNILGLSKRTEAIFKRNMRQVINTTDIGTDAHKENLVTDGFHYERLKKNQGEIMDDVGKTLGSAIKVLTWLTTNKLSNKQKIVPGVFQLVIENSIEEVDILLNKIQTLKRPFNTSSMLS